MNMHKALRPFAVMAAASSFAPSAQSSATTARPGTAKNASTAASSAVIAVRCLTWTTLCKKRILIAMVTRIRWGHTSGDELDTVPSRACGFNVRLELGVQ